MIAIDTNILVRIITRDDENQAHTAKVFLQNNCDAHSPAFVSSIVLCELVWILKAFYQYPKSSIVEALYSLTNASEFSIEHQQEAWDALEDFKNNNADFLTTILHISAKNMVQRKSLL